MKTNTFFGNYEKKEKEMHKYVRKIKTYKNMCLLLTYV